MFISESQILTKENVACREGFPRTGQTQRNLRAQLIGTWWLGGR